MAALPLALRRRNCSGGDYSCPSSCGTRSTRGCRLHFREAERGCRASTSWGRSPRSGDRLYSCLLPWLWLPLVVCLSKALLKGPADDRRWMTACLAIGPILVFTLAFP